jgi:histidine triad (HIT) family protein
VKRFLFGIVAVLICVTALWFVPTTRAFLARTLFNIALSPSMGKVVGLGFQYTSPLLPVERVLLTDKTIAFYHPRPHWTKHILLVPRKQVTTIFDLLEDKRYLESIYTTAHDVFLSQGFDADSYALLVNGGLRQDVKQVHFHLHQEKDVLAGFEDVLEPPLVVETTDFKVYQLAEDLYLALVPKQQLPPLSKWQKVDIQELSQLELPLPELEQRYNLNSRGFSLIIQEESELEQQQLIFHLTAGRLE